MKTVALLSLALALFGLTDAYTEDRSPQLVLKASGDNRPGASLRLYCSRGNVIVAFVLGPNDGRSKVDLAWRFDDGPTHRRRVHWTDTAHGIYLPDWGEFLAPSLYAGELTVQVDGAAALRFDLNAAREDITGFARDCGA